MDSFVLVVFGATGDLMRSKLLPALFSLYCQNKLPEKFFLVGFARRPFSDLEFRELFCQWLSPQGENADKWDDFSKNIYYQQGLFGEDKDYEELIKKLNEFDKEMGACIARLFYLATPPQNYETILDFLQSTGLSYGCGQTSNKWTKIVIEKPFGKDLETAKKLDQRLSKIFDEQQIFRVDHYLGKETVQNILTFRFANGVFEPVWNKNYIDHVQITFAESKGIEGRGEFFDGVGILRDVAQNHLMQLIANVAMDPPTTFTKEGVRDQRAMVISAISKIDPKMSEKLIIRGQYEGYKEEKGVRRNSETETFIAMKLFLDTERFSGVPFYIRAGKMMPKDEVSISIVFVQTCHILFKEYGCPETGNVLTIRIQPNEGISLHVVAKKPGVNHAMSTIKMGFTYQEEFGWKGVEAYEKVLLDIFAGDQMLFNRSDELASSWGFITDLMKSKSKLVCYQPGSWPVEADKLMERDGRFWL